MIARGKDLFVPLLSGSALLIAATMVQGTYANASRVWVILALAACVLASARAFLPKSGVVIHSALEDVLRIDEPEAARREPRSENGETPDQLEPRAAAYAKVQAGIERSIESLSASAGTLEGTADAISRAALRITTDTTSASVAAEDANRKVETLARSGQDFVAMITRIGDLAAKSSRMGVDAARKADATTTAIGEMSAVSEQIRALTTLIGGIANQTNLLALNATIEAARAGDQGRGFAVVAGEVKSLANETAKAVGTIVDMVAQIRGVTERAVATVQSIGAQVEALNAANSDIAQAVRERIRAASDMTESVDQVVTNVHFVMQAIGTIEAAADDAVRSAGCLRTTAGDVSREAASLDETLDLARSFTPDATEGAPQRAGRRADFPFPSSMRA